MDPRRFGMLADDLTGACDAGVQFAQRGFSTLVWVNAEVPVPSAPELTVISTNSRNEPPECARAKVEAACARLLAEGAGIVFKKLDSTLRGNIAAELEAVMRAAGHEQAFLAPAFPAMGRTVVDGWLHVRGVRTPVHIPSLLAEQQAPPGIRVFDAAGQEDLAAVAAAAERMEPAPLLAGSAGLAIEAARSLAARAGKTEPRQAPAPPARLRGKGTVLFFIGSTNPVTAVQVTELLNRRPSALGMGSARRALSRGRHLVLPIQWRPGELDGLPELLDEMRPCGMVFSGGDTACLLCWKLQAAGIRLEREVLVGIPSGTLIGGPFAGLPVATKAGGFGDDQALIAIADALSARLPT